MKRCAFPHSLSALFLTATAAILSGCVSNSFIPDTIAPEQGQLPLIQGTVFGGHAPLVGAHIYLLQPGTTGIGSQASSLLGGTIPRGATPPVLGTNPATGGDPNIPAGWKYVTTDGNGAFTISNGYTCSSGTPVYLYAYGGAPTSLGTAGNTPTTFNPAVVNLATLGVCPGSGSFLGTTVLGTSISYIYLNEISTVATAYAFQGFTLATNNDATHIGSTSSAEGTAGIFNAALNTFQLYDINGGTQSTVPVGEGHIANSKTFSPVSSTCTGTCIGPNKGLGTVPQAVLDTLGNILATCVDSGNNAATQSSSCGVLFANATADGTTTGTHPTDTATAAINIARHPGGVTNANFVSNLFGLSQGTVPFSPNLTNAPTDFTVGIQYPSSAAAVFTGAQSVATDANGNIWFTTQTSTLGYGSGFLAEISPLGVLLYKNNNTTFTYGNVTIDSSGNAWTGNLNDYVQNTEVVVPVAPATAYTLYNANVPPQSTAAAAAIADGSGNVYFLHGPTAGYPVAPTCCAVELTEVYSNRTDNSASPVLGGTFGNYGVGHGALDSAGEFWLTSDTGSIIARLSAAGTSATGFPLTATTNTSSCNTSGMVSPEQPAIDKNGTAWVPVFGTFGAGTGIFKITSAGVCTFISTGGGPYGATVDGASNIWISNRSAGTLTEMGPTGAYLSVNNYSPENQVSGVVINLLVDPWNLAVDISGDLIVTNRNGNSIVELIGAATPLYGPLGVAASANKIATTP